MEEQLFGGDYDRNSPPESAMVALIFGLAIGYIAGVAGVGIGVYKLARKVTGK